MKYSGIAFPKMFNDAGSTEVAVDKDKIRSDIALIIRSRINMVLMRPYFGVDADSILFAPDILVTEDFVRMYIGTVVEKAVPNVRYDSVIVTKNGSAIRIDLKFIYVVDTTELVFGYDVEGAF